MSRLAEAAGVAKLEGPVTVTYPDGSRTYPNMETADKAVGGRTVAYRRGGFFVEQGTSGEGDQRVDEAPAPAKLKKK